MHEIIKSILILPKEDFPKLCFKVNDFELALIDLKTAPCFNGLLNFPYGFFSVLTGCEKAFRT